MISDRVERFSYLYPRLPLELQEHIVSCLSPEDEWPAATTLVSCAASCHAWKQVAVKGLYSRIDILGTSSYQSLERTLQTNRSYASRVQTLSVHDATPAERVSHVALHVLPHRLSRLERLIIFGPQHSQKSQIIPFSIHPSSYASLSQFHSVHHIYLHQIEMDSLDELRKIVGALPNVQSAVFCYVSWKRPEDTLFKPCFNATSWRLYEISLSDCRSNFVAPFFWALPPNSPFRPNRSQLHKSCVGFHPALSEGDVMPIVEVAKLLLPVVEPMVGSICWAWKTTGERDGWYLECCADEVDSLLNHTYARFYFSDDYSVSSQVSALHSSAHSRVVSVEIARDEVGGLEMDRLDFLLKELQCLECIYLNFVRLPRDFSVRAVARQLPGAMKSTSIYVNGRLCGTPAPASPMVQHKRSTTCAILKKRLALQRPLIFQSLSRLIYWLRQRGLREEVVQAMKQLVKINKELARVDAARYTFTLVGSLHNLGRALSDFGQYEEALNHDEESLKISRDLVNRDSEKYTPTLADSLLNVGSDLSNLARHEESLKSNSEALDIRRRLATQDFAQYNLLLSSALHSVSGDLSHLGRHEEALKYNYEALRFSTAIDLPHLQCLDGVPLYNDEAIEIRRRAMKAGSTKRIHLISSSLHNIGVNLSELGRHEEALQYNVEALDIRRELAKEVSDEHSSLLAYSLHSAGVDLGNLGRYEEALQRKVEATNIRRILVKQNSIKYGPLLAYSLASTCVDLLSLGRQEDALGFGTEALEIRRGLAQELPSRFDHILAYSLHSMGAQLCGLGRHDEALQLRRETVKIRRDILRTQDSFQHKAELSSSLSDLASELEDLNQLDEALIYNMESLDIERKLAAEDATRSFPPYLDSLNSVSWVLTLLHRHPEALVLIKECIASARTLGTKITEYELSCYLDTLSVALMGVGQYEQALRASEDAVQKLGLSEDIPLYPQRADVLRNLAIPLLALDRDSEALRVSKKAVTLHRKLAQESPSNYEEELAKSLRVFADALIKVGRSKEATRAQEDATRIEGKFQPRGPSKWYVKVLLFRYVSGLNVNTGPDPLH